MDDAATLMETSRRLAAGELSSISLTQSLLEKSKGTHADLNAYITLLAESALREATESDERSRDGRRRSPLDGVPLAIKDLFDIVGVETTGGLQHIAVKSPIQILP